MKSVEDMSIFMLLSHLMHLSKYQAMKRMEDLDLKPSQAGILFVLKSEGGLSQRQLAGKIGITPPSMTVALRKLEKRGYICRKPDENDQRIVRIQLADKGWQCIEELRQIMEDMEEILHKGMSQEERLLLRRLLLQIQENLLECKDMKDMDMCSLIKKSGNPMKPDF